MSDFEDKLKNILSSPAELEKVMNAARSIAGTTDNAPAEAAGRGDADGISDTSLASALEHIDPKMLGLMTRLMGEYSSAASDKTALLSAMKPYLRHERHEKIDKALEFAKIAKLAKVAFAEFSGGERGV